MIKFIKALMVLAIVAAAGAFLYNKLSCNCNCDDEKCR